MLLCWRQWILCDSENAWNKTNDYDYEWCWLWFLIKNIILFVNPQLLFDASFNLDHKYDDSTKMTEKYVLKFIMSYKHIV